MGHLLANIDLTFFIASVVKIVFLTFLVILPMVAYSVYAERRFSAVIQDRVGPNRTGIPLTLFGFKKDIQILGIGGLLQPMADGLKFLLKEDFTPSYVRTVYFWLAPAIADGKVYVGSDDGYAYCLDAKSGSVIWKLRAGDRTSYAYYDILFSGDVQGLTNDSPVFYRGLRVGRVANIQLTSRVDTQRSTGRERLTEKIEVTVAVEV